MDGTEWLASGFERHRYSWPEPAVQAWRPLLAVAIGQTQTVMRFRAYRCRFFALVARVDRPAG